MTDTAQGGPETRTCLMPGCDKHWLHTGPCTSEVLAPTPTEGEPATEDYRAPGGPEARDDPLDRCSNCDHTRFQHSGLLNRGMTGCDQCPCTEFWIAAPTPTEGRKKIGTVRVDHGNQTVDIELEPDVQARVDAQSSTDKTHDHYINRMLAAPTEGEPETERPLLEAARELLRTEGAAGIANMILDCTPDAMGLPCDIQLQAERGVELARLVLKPAPPVAGDAETNTEDGDRHWFASFANIKPQGDGARLKSWKALRDEFVRMEAKLARLAARCTCREGREPTESAAISKLVGMGYTLSHPGIGYIEACEPGSASVPVPDSEMNCVHGIWVGNKCEKCATTEDPGDAETEDGPTEFVMQLRGGRTILYRKVVGLDRPTEEDLVEIRALLRSTPEAEDRR